MRNLTAPRCWRSTLAACALLSLTACASAPPQVVFKDRVVEVPVPVVQPIPGRLTEDCVPATNVGAGPVTVGAALDRLAAVEDALAACRGRLAEIRSVKP